MKGFPKDTRQFALTIIVYNNMDLYLKYLVRIEILRGSFVRFYQKALIPSLRNEMNCFLNYAKQFAITIRLLDNMNKY